MTTSNNSTVLKDVVAYVDVWSSDKTANYAKPFAQQLQEMGAQVSKTFNKQVTHVVFNNGHPATWRKAKKSDVRLVSVLWVGRCYDDGVHVDEELYPALNDESNPVMKNKKHRCMQPKDSPEKTPENDRRMRKKLDKLMKQFAPKEPLVTDVSPIIIDEENGIVYSPALKRSDYMAQRLKDMKDKRENLSPTASQMIESCSPVGQKPSLGSTPTVFKLMYEQSDEDSSASVAELGYSPDKEEGRTHRDVRDHDHLDQSHRKDPMKPWLSPCNDVPKRIPSVKDCSDFEGEEGDRQKKSRRKSVRKKPKSVDFLEVPCQDRRSDNSKNLQRKRRQSEAKSPSLSPNKSVKGKQKITATKSFTENESNIYTDTVNSSTSSILVLDDAAAKTVPLQKMGQKTPKRAGQSFSALVQSFSLSGESKSIASHSTDGDDDVFEDFFSPANHKQKSKRAVLPDLPVERAVQIPFNLDPVPKKRKQRRSESFGSETSDKKKRKLEDSQSGKHLNQQSDASSESQSHQQQDVKESLPALDCADETLRAKRRRQSSLAFARTTKSTSDSAKQRAASTPGQLTVLTEENTGLELQKNSDFDVLSHTLERNECRVAAGFTEIPSEAEENHNKQDSSSLHKMVNKTKTMRTLVMTSMPTEKQHTVTQVVKALGGFSIVDRVCESTTHVVSGGHRRTLNILLGIARGCWILSFEWILWSLEQRQWIPEEPYELSDQFPAAQICRLQRHLSAGEHQQDLFQGQPAMFVSQHSQPPTQSLMELIELCGGTVCKSVRQAGICIGKYSGRRPEGSRILSEQWVLDSITHLKKLSYDDYDLE
ncbi:microcephalin [Acanthochromis polyacanthus]|uniref:microcephalin n=1 Tax=Acanthochromis polyacanthus TaxID=80966 RepID=UPI0022341904|nr:microcephalin [Acanthochromis polyacanthus]